MNELRLTCRLVKKPVLSIEHDRKYFKFLVVHFPPAGETVALHCEADYSEKMLLILDNIPLGAQIGITGMIFKKKEKGIRVDVVDIKESVCV